jgi:hypothetical protein
VQRMMMMMAMLMILNMHTCESKVGTQQGIGIALGLGLSEYFNIVSIQLLPYLITHATYSTPKKISQKITIMRRAPLAGQCLAATAHFRPQTPQMRRNPQPLASPNCRPCLCRLPRLVWPFLLMLCDVPCCVLLLLLAACACQYKSVLVVMVNARACGPRHVIRPRSEPLCMERFWAIYFLQELGVHGQK